MNGSLKLSEYRGDIVRLSCEKMRTFGPIPKAKINRALWCDIRLPDLREEIAQCERRRQMHDACVVRYVDLVPRQ